MEPPHRSPPFFVATLGESPDAMVPTSAGAGAATERIAWRGPWEALDDLRERILALGVDGSPGIFLAASGRLPAFALPKLARTLGLAARMARRAVIVFPVATVQAFPLEDAVELAGAAGAVVMGVTGPATPLDYLDLCIDGFRAEDLEPPSRLGSETIPERAAGLAVMAALPRRAITPTHPPPFQRLLDRFQETWPKALLASSLAPVRHRLLQIEHPGLRNQREIKATLMRWYSEHDLEHPRPSFFFSPNDEAGVFVLPTLRRDEDLTTTLVIRDPPLPSRYLRAALTFFYDAPSPLASGSTPGSARCRRAS